ncbi:MAG: hypothetical protein RSA84_19255, partial [Acinetobacter sp.]
LGEAKGYMNTVVANFADNQAVPSYIASACDSLSATIDVTMYQNGDTVTFITPARGTETVRQDVECNVGNSYCRLIP